MIADWTTATGSRWVKATVASGNVRISGPSCSQVLGALQHPGVRATQEGHRLQDGLQVGVVRIVVQAEVEVAPGWRPDMPLQGVGAEVEVHDLALLLDRLGEPVVHVLRERRNGAFGVVLGPQAQVSRVETVRAGSFPAAWQRLLALPVRQCATARIGRDQVHQVRGSRTRHPDHDERRFSIGIDSISG